MLLLLAAAGILSYLIALHFANLAYDRWLYDSARTLAQEVRFVDGAAQVKLPDAAVNMFEWDDLDHIYYAVTSKPQKLIFGRNGFPPPPVEPTAGSAPSFYDADIDGKAVRVVALRLPVKPGNEEVTVKVGETRAKRNLLAKEILLPILVYQALVVGAAVALIWVGIQSGLQPLANVARAITARTAADLSPLEPDVPHEVRPIVDSLNDLLKRLEAALSAQKRFIADAAHQLRTPLSALLIQAERALREHDPEAHAEALRRVHASITRISHVTHQLLTLAKAEPVSENHQRIDSIDLAYIAREVTTEWVPAALSLEIDLGYTGPETGVPVFGDAQFLKELLNNLIDNALQYSGTGARVTVGVAASALSCALFVEDDGPGIPFDAREKVFERFFRLPGSGGGGCGLGLAIVKEIAQLHNGTVRVETGDGGKGTRVTVVFTF